MLYYNITTQELTKDNEFWGTGYSGTGEGRNNPEMANVPNIGPIPPGKYTIEKPPYTHPIEGPIVMNLIPALTTNDYGRSGFHIHGNNARNDASQGCIILGPAIRQQIADSSEDVLTVLAA